MYEQATVGQTFEKKLVSSSKGPVIVRFCDVSKAFRRYAVQPFLMRNFALRLVGRPVPKNEIWPLRQVSFEIYQGETVGIVGHNGSGKSTLLRLLAGACQPTEGEIQTRGRIAPLLSLGVGFQPDMSGFECVDMNATALGLTRAEIDARVEAISAFAELDEFMDTPVRYYSSGMLARLGFSIAIHSDPDLLILDEVLAVGDFSFQRKCLDRIREIHKSGVTIVLVSHDTQAITELCTRVLWLEGGAIVADGAPEVTVEKYLQHR